MLSGAGDILHEYDDEISRAYGHYSHAVDRLPGLLQRIVNGVANRVFADHHHHLQHRSRSQFLRMRERGGGGGGTGGHSTPLKVVNEMSSISSRGPSSLSENDNRMRNNSSRPSTAANNVVNSQQDTPPPSPNGSNSESSSKSCCFCWCCCCSCSCLTVKNGEDNNPRQQCSSLKEKEEPPTADEVLSWSESFDRLMQCNAGRKVFREFLRSEYSEENMLFWIACEDLKTTENPEMVEEKARLIYEDYISILSPKEVSLDSRVRELINRSMVEPTPKTFDEAQLQIYTLMHRDSYPRFLNSNIYKKLMEKFSDPPQQ